MKFAEPATTTGGHTFTRKGFQVCDAKGRDVMRMAERANFSVSKVAAELELSMYQFTTAIENAVGIGPKEFFRHYRAVLARWMISECIPLQDISVKLGFRYYTHFASEIRSFYGISPRDLQRILQPASTPKSGRASYFSEHDRTASPIVVKPMKYAAASLLDRV